MKTLTKSRPVFLSVKPNYLKVHICQASNPVRSGENQHRIPKKIHNNRQPCPCIVDRIGHFSFLANQYSRRRSISLGSLNRNLWRSQVSGCLRPCFNCKKCTFGLGRLSALYFGKRSLKDYKETYQLPIALFFYALIGPFPAAFALVYTIQAFTILKMAVLLCYIFNLQRFNMATKPKLQND